MQEEVLNDRGRVWADSAALAEADLYKDDVVYFSKNSDYEMVIDDVTVWRMTMNDLLYAEVK